MKVLFFLSNLNGGGAQKTIVNILRNLNREKFRPKLILLDYNINQPYAPLVPKDVPIININRRGRFAVAKIIRLIKSENAAVHFSTLPQVNILVSIAHKISRSSAKLILRETTHRDKKSMKRITFNLLRWSYNNCDYIVALSKGVSNEMEEMYDLRKGKTRVIYNPVEISMIKEKVTRRHKKNQNQIRLIACGRLVPLKNFQLLISALGKINVKFGNWTLDILGEGPDKSKLIKLSAEHNITDKINFLGFKTNPYDYMANSDLLVLTSKWEGFGHVIVESMAVGTPVVATNCPHGPREILSDGEFGWLVKNNDVNALSETLLEIFNDTNLIKEMREKATRRALAYDAKRIVQEYEKLLMG